MPEPIAAEFPLRLLAAILCTIAFLRMARTQMHPHPRIVWAYSVFTIGMIAGWRWLVFALLFIPVDLDSFILEWVQPMNQAMFAMLGMTLILLSMPKRRE